MHEIQINILHDLLFADALRYSDMKPAEMEGSQFTFHLDKLIKLGMVIKNDDGTYSLTESGKNKANRIDFDSPQPNQQAKHSVVMCGVRPDSKEILIYKRLKNPYYGRMGFPTGKVRYGERIIDTAAREFKEETNLQGEPELIAIRHYRVYFPEDTLVEDKVMYIHRIADPAGDLESNSEGEFFWVKLDEIDYEVDQMLPEFPEILAILQKYDGELTLAESEHYPAGF